MFYKIKNSLRELFLAPLKKRQTSIAIAQFLFVFLKSKYGIRGTTTFRRVHHMCFFVTEIVINESHYWIHETHGPYGERIFSVSNSKRSLFSVTSIPTSDERKKYTDSVAPVSEVLLEETDLYKEIVSIFTRMGKIELIALSALIRNIFLYQSYQLSECSNPVLEGPPLRVA